MSSEKSRGEKLTRRQFMKGVGAAAGAAILAGCAPSTPEVREVTRVVEKEVTKVVEKVVTPTEAPHVAKPVTIKWWQWWHVPDDPMIRELIERFESSHPLIKIEYDETPWKGAHDKLITSVVAGEGPDVHRSSLNWMGEMKTMGVFLPLNDWVDQWPYKDDIAEKAWPSYRDPVDGEILMLGHGMGCRYLYYRTDWLAEIGYPEGPKTHDEFLDACLKLNDPPDRYGYSMRGARMGHCNFESYIGGDGVTLFDEEGNLIFKDHPDAVEATAWYMDLYRKHKVCPPTAVTDSYAQMLAYFGEGKAAMFNHGINTAGAVKEKMGDLAAACPVPKGKVRKYTLVFGSGLAALRQSKNPDAAAEFVLWNTEPEQVKTWTQNPKNPLVPTLKSLLEDPFYRQDSFWRASLDQVPDWGRGAIWHPGFAEYAERVWPENFQKALLGEITTEQFIENIHKHFEQTA